MQAPDSLPPTACAARLPRTERDFLPLFLREQRRLYRFIRSLVPHAQDAEDILQETAAILWQEFDEFVEGTNFYAWACKVAHFRILKHRHKWSQSAALLNDEVLDQLATLAMNASRELDPRRSALEACLEKLRSKDRAIVEQRYGGQSSGRDVAHRLGRPTNSVYKSLGRIRRSLLDCIKREVAAAERQGGVL